MQVTAVQIAAAATTTTVVASAMTHPLISLDCCDVAVVLPQLGLAELQLAVKASAGGGFAAPPMHTTKTTGASSALTVTDTAWCSLASNFFTAFTALAVIAVAVIAVVVIAVVVTAAAVDAVRAAGRGASAVTVERWLVAGIVLGIVPPTLVNLSAATAAMVVVVAAVNSAAVQPRFETVTTTAGARCQTEPGSWRR